MDISHQVGPLSLSQGERFAAEGTFSPYPTGGPVGLMLHRSDPHGAEPDTYEDSSLASIQRYTQAANPAARLPFALLVDRAGRVTQSVALSRQTPHAVAGNATHIGIAAVGDFRRQHGADPTAPQVGALVGLCAHLAQCGYIDHGRPDWLVSHDADPAWTRLPKLESPGQRLPVDRVRAAAEAQLAYPVEGLDLVVTDAPRVTTQQLARPGFLDAHVGAAADRLWQGGVDEAIAQLDPLAGVRAAPEVQTKLLLTLGQAYQFRGSAQLRAGDADAAAASFAAARAVLATAQARAAAIDAAAGRTRLAMAVRLQDLQVRRAAAAETVDAALLADFLRLQEDLRDEDMMPAPVAFVDYLAGAHVAARAGYRAVLADEVEAGKVPGSPLVLCRLAQVELALGHAAEAARLFAAGIPELPFFPERDILEAAWASAEREARRQAA